MAPCTGDTHGCDVSNNEPLDAATLVCTLASCEAEDEAVFISSLGLGAEGTHKSQYSAYRIWLARLSQWLGWKIECYTLRIPSTRNWAIAGRERLPGDLHPTSLRPIFTVEVREHRQTQHAHPLEFRETRFCERNLYAVRGGHEEGLRWYAHCQDLCADWSDSI